MSGRRHLATAERLPVPLDLGMRASQMGADSTVGSIADLTVDLAGDSGAVLTGDSDLTEDSDSVVDSDAGVAALVLGGDGVGAGDGIRGGGAAGDRRGGDWAMAILATRTGE
jgi:hypothetical protein